MMLQKRLWLFVAMVAVCCGALAAVDHSTSAADQPFLGRWDLTLKTPTRPYPSWLELYEEQGQLKANMVGRWGNARPLPQVAISHGALMFTSPKDEENRSTDMIFKARLAGGKLIGATTGPDGEEIAGWTAGRITVKRAIME
jgi:hypothetical protein